MTTSNSRWLVAMLILSLASCAVTHDPALTKARDNVFHTRKTYVQGAVGGAIGGAALGAILGNQSRDPRGAEKGAIIGAVAGLAGGLMYANHVVHQRRAYKTAGDYLNDCSRVASAQRTSVESYNNTLASRAKSISKDEAALRGAIADSNAVLGQLRKEIALQETALRHAQTEGISISRRNTQLARIKGLKSEERRLLAQIERLSATEKPTTIGSR